MKNILIIAGGILAKYYLESICNHKNTNHNFTIIDYKNEMGDLNFGAIKHEILSFDPTSLEKLRLVASAKFDRFIVIMDDRFETITTYQNLKKINKDQEIYLVDSWKIGKNNEIFVGDSHLKLIDIYGVLTSRLMGVLPDSPILADNIGVGKGEIMEVKVPLMSAFTYRKIGIFRNDKFRIPMIYRHNQYIITKPNTTIYPNDSLLVVGEPTTLQSVYASIKRENGQFPLPFGTNIYAILDMRGLDEIKFDKFMADLGHLRSIFKRSKFYIRVINPLPNAIYSQIKGLDDEILINFTNDMKFLDNDMQSLKIGLIVMPNYSFESLKTAIWDLHLPVLTFGDEPFVDIKIAKILTQSKNLDQIVGVVFDVCAQLKIDINLHYFDPYGYNTHAITNEYKMLSELFKKEFDIINDTTNPIKRLQNAKNFLQFVPFNKSVKNRGFGAIFGRDIDALYYKLNKNHQFFIPSFYEI